MESDYPTSPTHGSHEHKEVSQHDAGETSDTVGKSTKHPQKKKNNRLLVLLLVLLVTILSAGVLSLFTQATQQQQVVDSEAQGMPPGVGTVGSVWLEATTSENGTVADVTVYASSATNVRQIVASVEWDLNTAYYDRNVPASINSGLDCWSQSGGIAVQGHLLWLFLPRDNGASGASFWTEADENCNSKNEGRPLDWTKAYPAGDRIPVGSFRIRSKVDGAVPLRLVFLTSIGNEYATSVGNPGNVDMHGTTVNMKASSVTFLTPTPLPTSAGVRPEFILNSATGKSCSELCQEQQMWCHSIGGKAEPVTGVNQFMGLGGNYFSNVALPAGSGPFMGDQGCGVAMTASVPYATAENTAPGAPFNPITLHFEVHQAAWTYCYCKSGPSPTPRPMIYATDPNYRTPTPRPEVTPITRASGSTTCECPLNYSCTKDGQSCISLNAAGPCQGLNRPGNCALYCPDGTKNSQCSENGPFQCTTFAGGLYPSCERCGCATGYVCNKFDMSTIDVLNDRGTVSNSVDNKFVGLCTKTAVPSWCGTPEDPLKYRGQCLPGLAPAYCQKKVFPGFDPAKEHNFTELVPNCQKCGCPTGETCNADGSCGITRDPGQICDVWKGEINGRMRGGLKCTGDFYVYPGYGSSNTTTTPAPAAGNPPPGVATATPVARGPASNPFDPSVGLTDPLETVPATGSGELDEFLTMLRNPGALEKFIALLKALLGLFGSS